MWIFFSFYSGAPVHWVRFGFVCCADFFLCFSIFRFTHFLFIFAACLLSALENMRELYCAIFLHDITLRFTAITVLFHNWFLLVSHFVSCVLFAQLIFFFIEFFAYTLSENFFFSLHTIGSMHLMLLHFPLEFHNFLIAATFIPWFCLLHLLDRVRKEFYSVPKNWKFLFRFSIFDKIPCFEWIQCFNF